MANRSISDVQDILYEVFPYLNPEYYADAEEIARAQKTLLHSALTCRAFTRPALNVLWSYLPSDRPLLELLCMLGFVRNSTTPEGPIYSYSSSDDPRDHPNWGYFQDYASQVRSIKLEPCTEREGSAWNDLAPWLRGDPVLPALRKVTLSQEKPLSHEDSDSDSMRDVADNPSLGPLWLIAPSVCQLSVSIYERSVDVSRAAMQEIVRVACQLTPNLETFNVATPLQLPVELEPLSSQKRLRVVDISPVISLAALTPLTSLPCLEDLSLTIHAAGESWTPFASNSVRVLTLRGPWTHLTLFLDQTDLPQLYSVSATVIQQSAERLIPECADFFRTLPTKHCTQITMLHVKALHEPTIPLAHFLLARAPAPTGGTLSAVVEPLLSLHQLRDVSLLFPGFVFPYSSSDIQSFAESWPELESFHLEFATQELPRAGFESLMHFALQCPRLRALHLPDMDLTREALEDISYPEEQLPHPLRELDVPQVAFPNGVDLSGEMASFTQRVFPYAASPQAAAHPIVVIDEETGDTSQVV